MRNRAPQDARLRARRLATKQEDGLEGAPLRELVQRLMATEEALAALSTDSPALPSAGDPALDDTRELILRQQGSLVRELRRRRAASARVGGEARRAPSAAWPPPPW